MVLCCLDLIFESQDLVDKECIGDIIADPSDLDQSAWRKCMFDFVLCYDTM